MKEINFRLTDEEYQFIDEVAKILGKSVPSLLKELSMKQIDSMRLKMALELYADNKIGFKKAWKLSNLPFIKFLEQLQEHNIEPNIPDELEEKMVNLASELTIDEVFSNKSREDLKKLIYSSSSK